MTTPTDANTAFFTIEGGIGVATEATANATAATGVIPETAKQLKTTGLAEAEIAAYLALNELILACVRMVLAINSDLVTTTEMTSFLAKLDTAICTVNRRQSVRAYFKA